MIDQLQLPLARASVVLAAAPIMGVNVVAVDQQMTDEQHDALIEQLGQHGVTTVRTALAGHDERALVLSSKRVSARHHRAALKAYARLVTSAAKGAVRNVELLEDLY